MPTTTRLVPSPDGILEYDIDIDWDSVMAGRESISPPAPSEPTRQSGTRAIQVPSPQGITQYELVINGDAVQRLCIAR